MRLKRGEIEAKIVRFLAGFISFGTIAYELPIVKPIVRLDSVAFPCYTVALGMYYTDHR